MASIVLELQQMASDSKTSVPDLLRKALMVAVKLKLDDFRSWLDRELRGYDDLRQVPAYRIIGADVKFVSPYYGLRPVFYENEVDRLRHTRIYLHQPVGELAALATSSKTLQVPFSDEEQQENMRLTGLPLETVRIVAPTQVLRVLDAVRTRVLDWSLELETQDILGKGMTFTREERERAHQSIHINQFTGVLGDVNSSQLQIGDFNSLDARLADAGISAKDRRELAQIVSEHANANGQEKANLAQRGLAWVMKHAAQLGDLSEAVRQWFQDGG